MTRANVFLGSLAFGAVVLALLQRRSADAELVRMRAALGDLDGKMNEMRRAAAEPHWLTPPAPVLYPPTADAPSTPVAASPAPSTSTRPSAAPPSPREQFAATRDVMDAHFTQESTDGAWAGDARRATTQKLGAVLPEGSILRSVDCRSSMCRIESEHAGVEQSKAFLGRAFVDMEGLPWNGPYVAGISNADDGSGRTTVVAFVAREGHELPPELDDGAR